MVSLEVSLEVASEAIRSRQRLPIHILNEEAPKRKLESRRVECAEPKRNGQERTRRGHPVGGAAVEHLWGEGTRRNEHSHAAGTQ